MTSLVRNRKNSGKFLKVLGATFICIICISCVTENAQKITKFEKPKGRFFHMMLPEQTKVIAQMVLPNTRMCGLIYQESARSPDTEFIDYRCSDISFSDYLDFEATMRNVNVDLNIKVETLSLKACQEILSEAEKEGAEVIESCVQK